MLTESHREIDGTKKSFGVTSVGNLAEILKCVWEEDGALMQLDLEKEMGARHPR